jgi:hypothetical protein
MAQDERALVVLPAAPPPGALLAVARTLAATTPSGKITLVQNNTYVSGSVDNSRKITTTTTTTENNNGDNAPVREEEEEEDERPGVPLPGKPQGSRLGKCFYTKCKDKEIVRDYSATGFGCSYYCCRHSCGGEVIHAACARAYSFEPGNMGRLVERPCTRCGCVLAIRTEVAFFQAIFFYLLDWPFWICTRVLPAVLAAGYLYKLWWFLLVVVGFWPVDTFANPQLVRQNAITGDNSAIRPRLTLTSFASFNFSEPSRLDFLCPIFATGCSGVKFISFGGFTAIKLYRMRVLGWRIPCPMPWFEYGFGWCAMYFLLYIVGPIYFFVWKWRWPQRIYRRITAKFQTTRVVSSRRFVGAAAARRRKK